MGTHAAGTVRELLLWGSRLPLGLGRTMETVVLVGGGVLGLPSHLDQAIRLAG